MPDAIGNRVSQKDVIDLTIEDSDDSTPPPVTLSARPSFTSPWRIGSNVTIPEHGLPINGAVRSLTERESEISKILLPNASGFVKVPSKTRHSGPSKVILPQQGSSKLHNISSYVTSNAKRRRVNPPPWASEEKNGANLRVMEIPPSPEAEVLPSAKSSTRTPLSIALLGVEKGSLQIRPAAEKDAVNKSLKLALRQQVFPHINQRLIHYRRSIDSVTRKQLGKKTAWEICDREFMDNLQKNDGRLPAAFEDKVAAMAQSLVDKFAEESLRNSKVVKTYGAIFVDNSTGKDAQKIILPSRDASNEKSQAKAVRAAAAQVEAIRAAATQAKAAQSKLDEAAKARMEAKLRATMKARWESGEMKVVMAKRWAENRRKKAVENASHSNPAKLNNGNKVCDYGMEALLKEPRAFQDITSNMYVTTRRTDPVSVICIDTSDSSDNEIAMPSKSISSCTTPSTALSRNNVRQSAAVTTSSQGERKGILKLDTGLFSKRFAAPHSAQIGRPVERARLLFKAKTGEKIRATKPTNGQMTLAQSVALTQKLENLRLAVLDDGVSRPYLKFQDRQDILRSLKIIESNDHSQAALSMAEIALLRRSIIHVDFSREEIEPLVQSLESLSGRKTYVGTRNSKAHIESLLSACQCLGHSIAEITSSVHQYIKTQHIPGRTHAAVDCFLDDAASGLVSTQASVTRIQSTRAKSRDALQTPDFVTAALQEREIWGRRRDFRSRTSIKVRILCHVEDKLARQAEWTDCSGDIATVAWIDGDRYLCGATAHSDEHNMQYNKPGNLLVGSISKETMRSIAGHQVVRPIVTSGENATESMRHTQDPWLYSSVTSTVYSFHIKKCFTGSYDQTVKVWNVNEDGSAMELCGTWLHSGNVNFVVASSNHNLIATAADVCEDAVRVYLFNPDDIDGSIYTSYEPSVQERNGNDTWAYFPATMQWGISSTVSQLLLVGYSPRSFDCYDGDIPEDKLNTGELCLWNVETGIRVPISSGRTQNVFEVVWHPSQPIFVAATSPAGEFESCVKTQLRIFGQTQSGAFTQMKTLDCPALDVNEITIMPNSQIHCYVTASCTDGNSYVWDSALSDKPIHILSHGDSIDDQVHGSSREESDSGVKFAAWGKCSDRFYTGSSDGVVKVWNVCAPPGEAFLRDLIALSGGVSTGKFSPDYRQLVIGDSTGKIHLFSSIANGIDRRISSFTRTPITPHAPLPPPLIDEDDQDIPPEQTGPEIGRQYLERQQIVIHPDEYIGAVQGPNYYQTGLFYNAKIYKDDQGRDAEGWSEKELEKRKQQRFEHKEIKFPRVPNVKSSNPTWHEKNLALDLNLTILPRTTITRLINEGVDLRFQDENEFRFELDRRLEKPKKSNMAMLIGTSCADKKYASDDSDDNDSLDECEIQELQKLQTIIQRGLRIHQGLRDLF